MMVSGSFEQLICSIISPWQNGHIAMVKPLLSMLDNISCGCDIAEVDGLREMRSSDGKAPLQPNVSMSVWNSMFWPRRLIA
jgi:hypothetical protein